MDRKLAVTTITKKLITNASIQYECSSQLSLLPKCIQGYGFIMCSPLNIL